MFLGKPIGASLDGQFFTVFTMNGFVKLFDVVRHEPRPLMPAKSGYDMFSSFGEVIAAKCNANGTMLALTVANENLLPDGKLYVWHLERDVVRSYDFLNAGFARFEEDLKCREEYIIKAYINIWFRLPITFAWDTNDPRLLACETRCVAGGSKDSRTSGGATMSAESQVNVMFVTDKGDIKELQVVSLSSGELLVNLCVPNVVRP